MLGPDELREKAAACRAEASKISDPVLKYSWSRTADNWLELAKTVELLQRQQPDRLN